jgi:hypothetical protein
MYIYLYIHSLCVCIYIHIYTNVAHLHVYTYLTHIHVHTHTICMKTCTQAYTFLTYINIHIQARIQALEERLALCQNEKDGIVSQLTELQSLYAAALNVGGKKEASNAVRSRDRDRDRDRLHQGSVRESSVPAANRRCEEEDTLDVYVGRARWLMAQNVMLTRQVRGMLTLSSCS